VLVRVPAHDPSFPSEAVVSPLLLLLLLLLLRCCCGGVVVVVVVSDSVAVVIATLPRAKHPQWKQAQRPRRTQLA